MGIRRSQQITSTTLWHQICGFLLVSQCRFLTHTIYWVAEATNFVGVPLTSSWGRLLCRIKTHEQNAAEQVHWATIHPGHHNWYVSASPPYCQLLFLARNIKWCYRKMFRSILLSVKSLMFESLASYCLCITVYHLFDQNVIVNMFDLFYMKL